MSKCINIGTPTEHPVEYRTDKNGKVVAVGMRLGCRKLRDVAQGGK